ncbi:hypothetical protein EJV47_25060 [Hymenobacter gummosus]|uniref:site-specific DNA-methyltransferase (adenine-specific) n=1 Tax=Hymenobacter gummosus TaxID=1776032 RepID=A0A3S0H5F3_9BACT|nr:Eco57I restriction-modification methylase domain-containing protein [Hymenobacter gummosus]RTQ45413.1 hypothetical protein EJV47_25060 [Hymenobacter gummosus]
MATTRTTIQASLQQFHAQPNFRASATNFFKALGYESARTIKLSDTSAAGFTKQFDLTADQFDSRKALTQHWQQFEFLFQFGEKEVQRAAQGDQTLDLFNQGVNKGEKNSFFFHAVKLRHKPDGYRRTELADMTRQLNRPFGIPTVVLFEHSSCLTLGVIDRRPTKSKKSSDQGKDVLEKVTLIKDIDLHKPHPAHVHILEELRLGHQAEARKVNNFDALLTGWRATLSTTELNKRFYRDLANWYFWALQHVQFPIDAGTDPDTHHHTALIRLITRLIFVWFLREKKLVPADLFRKKAVDNLLNYQDKTGSTYYKAILQNLFFATLNAEMNSAAKPDNRRFINDQDTSRNGQYLVHSLYRYERFFADKAAALALFANVPFLNGGLFECLDSKKDGQPENRVDCFSDNPKNEKRLTVPDFLFFQEDEQEIDLNAIYDTKRRHYRVRGLLSILSSYKFTVTENTPVEEEVALDPELLGKVFENLLASYNPETKTTARKQTGSFYTPREVVDFMVDESLIVYLGAALAPPASPSPAAPASYAELGQQQTTMFANEGKKQATLQLQVAAATPAAAVVPAPSGELLQRLRHLLAYNNDAPAFDTAEKQALLTALHHCRILDPACGSGAYPMGVLHKMVFLLNKLDPDNQHWRELQRQKAMQELDDATKIVNDAEREARLREINDVFKENLHDYTRKLFLIENCIYGVDLQPIAVQISKLRFFISLVVDQKPDDTKHNRGIRPLPNLETKFVAANSLISLDNEFKGLFRDQEIEELEQKLRDVRHQHFQARTWATKKKWRDEDEKLRQHLVQRIELRAAEHEARLTAKLRELEQHIETTKRQLTSKATAGDQAKRRKALEQLQKDYEATKAKRLDRETVRDSVSQVGRWNPYDQNASAPFFDSEWMFGKEVQAGFDLVIGNPPYVQIQNFSTSAGKEQEKWAKQGYASYTRTGDVYCLFYEQGMRLLRSGGFLSYITSNSWMRAGYGSLLRNYFSQHTNPLQLLDFAKEKVFDSVTVNTNVLLTQKAPNQQQAQACVIGSDFASLDNLSLYFQQRAQPAPFAQDGKAWVVLNEMEAGIKAKIEAAGTPLKEWDVQINYGIKTGYNEAFIIDAETKDKLLEASPKSAEIIRPLLEATDLTRYVAKPVSWWFINAHNGAPTRRVAAVNIPTDHPAIHERFLQYRERLSKRGDKGANWYNLRACSYLAEFEKPKLSWGNLSTKPRFSLDMSGAYLVAPCNMLTTESESLYYLSGVLNSTVCYFFMRNQGYTRDGGYIEYKKQFVEQLPVPRPDMSTQTEIANLVRQLIENKKRNISLLKIEEEIDALIYTCFGLTQEEATYLKNWAAAN